jgi:hypothetical protein
LTLQLFDLFFVLPGVDIVVAELNVLYLLYFLLPAKNRQIIQNFDSKLVLSQVYNLDGTQALDQTWKAVVTQ